MVYLKNVDVPEALSPGEHARIVSENGHDYVRMLMSSVTGKDYSEVPFSHHPGGKPYFRECPCHFSLSHSGTLLAVAISASDVGIDIEKIGHFSEKVAERIFTGNEKQYYDAKEKRIGNHTRNSCNGQGRCKVYSNYCNDCQCI